MWIELEDDILNNYENIEDPFDKRFIALNALFDAMWKCQHIIYASDVLLRKLEKHPLINPVNQSFIMWIRQNYIYVYECFDIIQFKAIVSNKIDVVTRKDAVFYIPLTQIIEMHETKLLTENETDAKLFKRIFTYIFQKEKMSTNFFINMENDAFHGGNVSAKIQQESESDRIMLCIVDSDRDYENGECGGTLRAANSEYKKIKDQKLFYLYELKVREKENLFSPGMYLLVSENGLLEVISDKFDNECIYRYFDIKEGVKSKKLCNANARWQQHYGSLIEACKNRGVFKETEREDDYCIKGIGGKLNEIVADILLETNETKFEDNMKRNSLSKERKEKIRKEKQMVLDKLPTCLKLQWRELYLLLFSWGCCLSKKVLPMYENK